MLQVALLSSNWSPFLKSCNIHWIQRSEKQTLNPIQCADCALGTGAGVWEERNSNSERLIWNTNGSGGVNVQHTSAKENSIASTKHVIFEKEPEGRLQRALAQQCLHGYRINGSEWEGWRHGSLGRLLFCVYVCMYVLHISYILFGKECWDLRMGITEE